MRGLPLFKQKILRDRYTLPLIEEVIEGLYDATYFSTLDIRNRFFHVDAADESAKYTAFVTPYTHYEFLKASLGLSNFPSIFQRYINTVFQK